MAAKKENFPKLNFRIKLLAGSNVVLVESNNYESELFTPQIVNGRITFLNVIPNRRCQVTKANIINYAMKESREASNYFKEHNENQKSAELKQVSPFYGVCAPLANSTPAGVKHGNSSRRILFDSKSRVSLTDSSLKTPELVRRAVPAHSNIFEKSMLNLPNGVLVSRLYHNHVQRTPKNVGSLVSANAGDVHNSSNASILNGSYLLHCSLSTSSHNRSENNYIPSTSVDSIASWQKVLTPVRTYTRKSKKRVTVRRPATADSAIKALTSFKFTPTYLVNPTQAPKVTQLIEIKKRKLIVDGKVCISPKTFKKQQDTDTRTQLSTTSQTNSLSLHKSCLNLESMAMSAFDLLTNSNRSSCMARKLNEQFRKGCVNKASSTYYKYKLLTTVPPLQHDEQILKLSRISLTPSQSAHDMITMAGI